MTNTNLIAYQTAQRSNKFNRMLAIELNLVEGKLPKNVGKQNVATLEATLKELLADRHMTGDTLEAYRKKVEREQMNQPKQGKVKDLRDLLYNHNLWGDRQGAIRNELKAKGLDLRSRKGVELALLLLTQDDALPGAA